MWFSNVQEFLDMIASPAGMAPVRAYIVTLGLKSIATKNDAGTVARLRNLTHKAFRFSFKPQGWEKQMCLDYRRWSRFCRSSGYDRGT